jgi:hypothetical protein
LIVFLFLLLAPRVSHSQIVPGVIELNHGCLYKGQNNKQKVFIKSPLRTDYVRLANKISSYLDVKFKFFLFEAKFNNAGATIINGNNIIIYDPEFLDKIINEVGNKHAAELILAHEFGHLIDLQNLKVPEHSWWNELNADKYAGAYCFKANVHSQVFYDVSRNFPRWQELWKNNKIGESTHPYQTARIKSMVSGYWHQQLIGPQIKTAHKFPLDTLLMFLKTFLNRSNISTKSYITYGYDVVDLNIVRYFDDNGKRKKTSIPITRITSIDLRPHDCGEILFEVDNNFEKSEILRLGGDKTNKIFNTYQSNGWHKYMVSDDEQTTIEAWEVLKLLTALIRDIKYEIEVKNNNQYSK